MKSAALAAGLAAAAAIAAPYSAPLASGLAGASGAAAIWAGLRLRDLRKRRELAIAAAAEEVMEAPHALMALDELASGIDHAIFIVDPDSAIAYANQAAIRQFGIPDPIGLSLVAVVFSSEVQELAATVRRTGHKASREVRFQPSEAIARVTAWRDRSGSVFVIMDDITEVRRLERVRQDFVANVSHELRTPMASVRAMAETLLDDPDDESIRRPYLERTIKEIDRLTNITDDLLILARADRSSGDRSRVDLSEIVQSLADQHAPFARAKGLEWRAEIEPGLQVMAASGALAQIAVNLIENAISYTPDGLVEVVLDRHEGQARLAVADTGIGIALEHQGRIFERFYRADKSRSRSKGGTGLGLSIVKNLAEAFGGSVSLESRLGEGSVFTVVLPLAPAVEEG
jgi:two-component system phosphate regulon sensor histidine kinase PhoR